MSEGLVTKLRSLLASKPSVRRVADDPTVTAQIMLLAHAVFADGHLDGAERVTFATICRDVFAIPEADVPEVLRYIADVGYETSAAQAASSLSDLPSEEREGLARELVRIVFADRVVHPDELAFLRRVAVSLDLAPGLIEQLIGDAPIATAS